MKKIFEDLQNRIPKKIQMLPKLPKWEFFPLDRFKIRIFDRMPSLMVFSSRPLKEWKALEKRLNQSFEKNMDFSPQKKQEFCKWCRRFREFLSAPFIYSMIIPAVVMHLFLEIFHQICFRLYQIPRVTASDYFKMKRVPMPLNIFEKFNCAYCSYFNGLAAYTQEIAGRTEKYWCPIKHLENRASTHPHYENFTDCAKNRKDLKTQWNENKKMDDLG